MSKELLVSWESKITRLVGLVAMMFVISMIHQYVETPYMSSVFSRKASSRGNVEDESEKTEYSDNILSSIGIGDPDLSSPNPISKSNGRVDRGDTTRDGSSKDDGPIKNSTSGNTNSQDEYYNTNSSKPAENSVVNSISGIISSPDHMNGDELQVIFSGTKNMTDGVTLVSTSPPPILPIISTSPLSTVDIVKVHNMTGESGIIVLSGSSVAKVPSSVKKRGEESKEVMSLSDMNKLLIQSQESSNKMNQQWNSASEPDKELFHARSMIENALVSSIDERLYAPLYRNASRFMRSYELMEKILKVYIYKEGKKPIFHQPVLRGIYASEGWFMKLMEANKNFVTTDPEKAHLFYLPFSSRMLEETLYIKNSHSSENLIEYLGKYLSMISTKYVYWNRTSGADHFLVACHDWAPAETRRQMGNCIRAICNSDVNEGFHFGKDVSFPETRVRYPEHLLKDIGGKAASEREILVFFAGSMHGSLRTILMDYWGGGRDGDVRVFGRMKGEMSYIQHMKNSKYCICAKGYEVNSPRVVEAIFYECVPVIISDNFVPPFFEIFDWESFAIFIAEKDIPRLKMVLESVPHKRYLEMQMAVKRIQHHFLWHDSPVRLGRLGALEHNKLVEMHQGWRLVTCIWLHAGVVHLLTNMLSLVFIGVRLEQQFGFVRICLIYLLSGFGGSVLSSLFIQSNISVGASGSLFGLLGAMLSELITNWSIYANKAAAMLTLLFIIVINLGIGFLPHVDNFAHIGGFGTGFLLGFILLPRPQFAWMQHGTLSPHMSKWSKYKSYQYILWLMALVMLVVGMSLGLIMVLRGENGNAYCSWCHYLRCFRTSNWNCNA